MDLFWLPLGAGGYSVTAWLLAAGGIAQRVDPPARGSAPGWDAGLAVARRASARASPRSLTAVA